MHYIVVKWFARLGILVRKFSIQMLPQNFYRAKYTSYHGFKSIFFLESLRYAICICAAMAAMDAKLDYSCAKWHSFSAAIALFLAQCYSFGLLES